VGYSKFDFGEDFYWGVSTAAYQIEGAHNLHGKGMSIWDKFVQNSSEIKDGSHANVGCNFYEHFENDLDLIQEMQIPNYRFSISWSRVLPNGIGEVNQAGIDFYNRLIDACLERNITPWVTLYHWDLPQALEDQGGWTNREILNWFEEFATLCATSFGDRVTHWMVLNEPMVFTGAGYFLGYHAPGRKGMSNFLSAMHHATLCQSLGARILRNELEDAKIGTTFSCSHIDPLTNDEKDVAAANRFDALLNRLFIEPALGLGYPLDDLPIAKRVEKYMMPNDESRMHFDFDFIGVQNYTREVVKANWMIPYMKGQIVNADERKVPLTTMNWEVYPQSIYKVLKKFDTYEGVKELVITENGVAFPEKVIEGRIKDLDRIQFVQSYLNQVLKAQREGVNVTGYFIWTLLDNFEWAEGYTQRFGLIHTDFETQERIIKDSGRWYKRFLQSAKVRNLVV